MDTTTGGDMDSWEFTFGKYGDRNPIIEGLDWAVKDMTEKGMYSEKTTSEDLFIHAGRHVILTAIKEGL